LRNAASVNPSLPKHGLLASCHLRVHYGPWWERTVSAAASLITQTYTRRAARTRGSTHWLPLRASPAPQSDTLPGLGSAR
jgi:hypothetical protein